MKKLFALFVMSIAVNCFAQSEVKNDSIDKYKFVNGLDKMVGEYGLFCYKDSVKIRCFIHLISDGQNSKMDTVCGINRMEFNMKGNVPVPYEPAYEFYYHTQPTAAGFFDWINKKYPLKSDKKN